MAIKTDATHFSNTDEQTEVSVRQLLQQLESQHPPFLLDVRQPEELQNDPAITAAVNIPLGQLMAHLAEVPKDKPVVIVCHSGSRSLLAQKFLTGKGYDCKSLAGGMVAWNYTQHALP